jgi:hypothetical protein
MLDRIDKKTIKIIIEEELYYHDRKILYKRVEFLVNTFKLVFMGGLMGLGLLKIIELFG